MELGFLGEDLVVFTSFFVLVTGACLGTSVTLGADWAVLLSFLRSVALSRLGTFATALGVGSGGDGVIAFTTPPPSNDMGPSGSFVFLLCRMPSPGHLRCGRSAGCTVHAGALN